MIDYNEDYEYAHQRLVQTVVRVAHSGLPVWVNDVFIRDKQVNISPLTNLEKATDVSLKELNLSSPPLGFVNHNSVAVFLMRVPKRRDWKQGLRPANCQLNANGLNVHFMELLKNNSLHNCIIGKYPSLPNILREYEKQKIYGRGSSLAWDRHWALTPLMEVLYKDWGVVGLLSKEDKDIKFQEGFSFLRESFEESVR